MIERNFVVTTGMTASPDTVSQAEAVATELGVSFVRRRGIGISRILAESGAEFVVVVQASRLLLHDGVTEYAYHPNMLLVRGLNVLRGWRDVYVDACEFREGESVLDCTLGFGCEASLASLAVGETGRVVGLESEPALALLSRTGLRDFKLETPVLKAAMGRIDVVCADYSVYLADAADYSFDVVCLDPFFDERISGSEHSVSPLARFGNPRPLDDNAVLRARRVARRRVVVKHPRYTELPESLVAVREAVIVGRKAQTAYSVFGSVAE
ncbi:MAG TPA: class I SAM-dependent methyltransferase [Capsulimonadaceae bacterium]|jgi:hypothetical protein